MLLALLVMYYLASRAKDNCFILSVFAAPEVIALLSVHTNYGQYIKDWHIYAISAILWSHLFTTLNTKRTLSACVIMFLLSCACAVDAYYYGIGGINEGVATDFFIAIGYVAPVAHFVFICSFIDVTKNTSRIRTFTRSLLARSGDSYHN